MSRLGGFIHSADRRVSGLHVRAFGRFVTVELRSRHRPYFSERHGHRRWYYFGPICWMAGKLIKP